MKIKYTKRNFLKLAAISGMAISTNLWAQSDSEFWVKRLNWSGLQIRNDKADLFIDPILTDIWGGENKYPFFEIDKTANRKYVLITHTHGDHFDVSGLKAMMTPKDWVICEESQATYIASRGFQVIPVKMYEPVQRRGFTMIPVPAVDGTGDEQVSWIVMVNGQRFIHGGDTIWHGKWRSYAAVYGPFDAAFLPINGAIQADDPPSEIPLSLTPKQAVDAALLLSAKTLIPIHYGFHVEGSYEEVNEPLQKTIKEAKERNLKLRIIKPGENL